jgi:hypothetical protein
MWASFSFARQPTNGRFDDAVDAISDGAHSLRLSHSPHIGKAATAHSPVRASQAENGLESERHRQHWTFDRHGLQLGITALIKG